MLSYSAVKKQNAMPVARSASIRMARENTQASRRMIAGILRSDAGDRTTIQRSPADSGTPTKTEKTPENVSTTPQNKVLVTGFNDWQNLGTPPNTWICNQNPSCRLLIGAAATSAPTSFSGPLVTQLTSDHTVQWTFKTLPTTWGIARTLRYQDYDAVINMGLGVYDTPDALQLEQGAWNERAASPDAAGNQPSSTSIDPANSSTTLATPAGSDVDQRTASVDQTQATSNYRVRVAQARQSNNFICNETHYHALSELAASLSSSPAGRLKRVYFLHLPQPRTTTGFAGLAAGAADVIRAIIR
jgi:pyrrolidone-carboxylate peptidase